MDERAPLRADRAEVTGHDGVRLAVSVVSSRNPAVADRSPGSTHRDGSTQGDQRPVAVVAHGAGSSARFVIEAFGWPLWEAGYRLVTYDLRGHGDSEPVPDVDRHTLHHHVADLTAVVDRFRPHLVGGVSLGAHAAAAYATGHGVGGLLLCMPAWTGRARRGEGPHAVVADAVRSLGVAEVLRRAVADTPTWLGTLLSRDWSRCDPDSLRASLLALDGADAPHLVDLRTIAAPTGVVGWPGDPGHPLRVARGWAAAIPRAVIEVTTLDAVGADLRTLGDAAVAAWHAARRS